MADRPVERDDAAWADVHRRLLAELDELTDAIVDRLRRELPGYAAIPAEGLRPTLREHLRGAIRATAQGRGQDADLLQTAAAAAALRAEQDVPVDDVLRAWRIGATELWRRQQHIAAEIGVDVAEQLAAARTALENVDDSLSVAAAGYQAGIRRRDGPHAAQRVRLLRGLVLGISSTTDLDLLASGYRLTPDQDFRAVRARPDGDAQAREAERAVLAAGPILIGWVDGELLAVLPADAGPLDEVVAGVGDPATPTELPRSFGEAQAALTTATAFRRGGPATLDDLGAEVVVATRPEIGARLAARYIEPLQDAGATGADVLATVDSYLKCGLRVHRTAQTMFVHPNTVRHRLRRFEQLTGAQLDEIGDVVAVWWALRHEDVHGS